MHQSLGKGLPIMFSKLTLDTSKRILPTCLLFSPFDKQDVGIIVRMCLNKLIKTAFPGGPTLVLIPRDLLSPYVPPEGMTVPSSNTAS